MEIIGITETHLRNKSKWDGTYYRLEAKGREKRNKKRRRSSFNNQKVQRLGDRRNGLRKRRGSGRYVSMVSYKQEIKDKTIYNYMCVYDNRKYK